MLLHTNGGKFDIKNFWPKKTIFSENVRDFSKLPSCPASLAAIEHIFSTIWTKLKNALNPDSLKISKNTELYILYRK